MTFDETLFYDTNTPDITQQLQVKIEHLVEVVDMTSSYFTIDNLDCDIDTDSDLDEDIEVQQSTDQ